MRPVIILALLHGACSPADEKGAKPADQDRSVSPQNSNAIPGPDLISDAGAVPFSKLGWAESRFTWEGNPFTGVTIDHYKNGQLKARYHIKEGVYHGLIEEWYENGKQKTRTSYENGLHQGDNFYWNSDGSLQVHKVWKDDVLVSESHPESKP